LSNAVATPETKPVRLITKPEDRGLLLLYGADLSEPALVDEYFEFRSLPNQGNGGLETAILKSLIVSQNKRKAKKKDK
jgi:hypothetical protein